MDDEVGAMLRMLEHHRGSGDALTVSSFHLEDLPLQHLEEEVSTKLRRLEHHRGLDDTLTLSSFHLEDLPLEIQQLVMSLLSLKEAARTSIVARNWRKLWTCYPNLCFAGRENRYDEEDSIKIKRAKFIETVNSIIQQHSGIGLNKFSVKFTLPKKFVYHLDRWICFAIASKARIIDIDLQPRENGPPAKVYNFPLDALGAQDGPFIQSLFLKDVSIKPHSDISGLTTLRRLHLRSIHIVGDLSGLLNNCCTLEDLEIFACFGVGDVNVPLQLNKLRHVLISHTRVRTIDLHVAGLTHFEYKGGVIPIALHGCSKLEKASLTFKYASFEVDRNALGHAFTTIPAISSVKELYVHADMVGHQPAWLSQVHMMVRPTCMFMLLRHLTCEITIFTDDPNSHDGILQFAHYLDYAPLLEVLQLHMMYFTNDGSWWCGEATGELLDSLCTGGLDHLKTVYMSGFRCYRAQVELLCGILRKGAALEHVTIQPIVTIQCVHFRNSYIDESQIREWARGTSRRFGKAINVVGGSTSLEPYEW